MKWRVRGMTPFTPSRQNIEDEKQLIAEGRMSEPDPGLVERLQRARLAVWGQISSPSQDAEEQAR